MTENLKTVHCLTGMDRGRGFLFTLIQKATTSPYSHMHSLTEISAAGAKIYTIISLQKPHLSCANPLLPDTLITDSFFQVLGCAHTNDPILFPCFCSEFAASNPKLPPTISYSCFWYQECQIHSIKLDPCQRPTLSVLTWL